MMLAVEHYAYFFLPLAALLLDTLLGDPRSSFHPVVLIGKVISFYENIFYHSSDRNTRKIFCGFLTVLAVLFTVGLAGTLLIMLGNTISFWVGYLVQAFMLYITISPRSLAEAGREIASLLARGKIEKARSRTGWIVGRDTTELNEGEVTRAVIETVAENTVDGITAPLFFFVLFGPVGALFYRTANTMDSMLGYKNERYLYFGRFAAKLDDFLTWLPARLTFLLLVGAAKITGHDARKAWHIGLRDASKHPSPNGGYAEAPVAGALHIRLGGYNKYGDKMTFRAYMGDQEAPLQGQHIKLTIGLMYCCTIEAVILSMLLVWFSCDRYLW